MAERITQLLLILSLPVVITGCSESVWKSDQREMADSLMQKAQLEEKQGDIKAAIRLYEKALQQDPDLARAHLDLALLLHDHQKDYAGAICHYRRYLRLRPRTEKKDMIESRIRLARHLFAASILGADEVREGQDDEEAKNLVTAERLARIEALEEENAVLRNRAEFLARELQKLSGDLSGSDATPELRRAERSAAGAGESDEQVEMASPRISRSKEKYSAVYSQREGYSREQTGETSPAYAGQKVVRTYCVRSGDTLSSIAVKMYRDVSKWREIYQANRETLGGSNRLRVGQILIIP